MPQSLNMLEEFDILSELQFPDYIYSLESIEEQIAFSKYIMSLSDKRILLLHEGIFDFPFVVASLTNNHIESILKDGSYSVKKILIYNINDSIFINQVIQFVSLLDKHNKTTENSTRLKNILQYLKDIKSII